MSFSLHQYSYVMKNIKDYSNVIRTVLQAREDESRLGKMDEVLQRLENDQFQIAVVGEFGRGKSMFINALLGEKVLPSSPLVTTTILNHITYGDEQKITLHYHDDQPSQEISKKEFKKLVAPKDPILGDKASEKEYAEKVQYIQSVEYADIQHPIPFCKEGVRMIDTPGLEDGDAMRDHLTSNIIPRSDAAVLILSAKAALSASEKTLLKDRLLKNDIQKIFIVINFKDSLRTPEDESEVMNHVRNNLGDILGHPRIHLVSAKQALTTRRIENGEVLKKKGRIVEPTPIDETGMVEFEQDLAQFLQYERGKVKLERPMKQLIRIIEEVTKEINTEMKALTVDVHHLNRRLEDVRAQLNQFRRTGSQATENIRTDLMARTQELTHWYDTQMSEIKKAGLEAFHNTNTLDTELIMEEVETAIAPLERKLHEDKIEYIHSITSEVMKQNTNKLNSEWKKINVEIDGLLGDDQSVTGPPSTFINESSSEQDLFFEIYEELEYAWKSSQSLLSKALVFTGFAITGFVEGAVRLVKALFGNEYEEKRKKIYKSLNRQLNDKNKQKRKHMEKEWKEIMNSIQRLFDQTIQDQVQQKHHQLTMMEKSTQVEKDQIHHRKAILEQQISNLTLTKQAYGKATEKLESVEEGPVFA